MAEDWSMPDAGAIRGTPQAKPDLPPHSQEAEDGVIGCILASQDAAASMAVCALSLRGPECFYIDANQIIYGALLRMVERRDPIDIITVQVELKKTNELEKIGGLTKLTSLQDATPSAAFLTNYLPIVVEHARRRRVIQAASAVIRDAKALDSGADSIDVGISGIALAAADRGGPYRDIKTLTREVIDRLSAKHAAPEPLGLMVGIREFDHMTGGLEDTDKWIIAARPSMGKTALATTIIRNVAHRYPQRGKAVFLSFEMSAAAITSRLIAAQAELNLKHIKIFGEPDFRKLTVAQAVIGKAPIIVRDSEGWTMTRAIAEITTMRSTQKLSVVVLDHLGEVEPPETKRQMNDREIASYHASRLKAMSRAAGCPIIILHQMNRDIEKRSSGPPRLSDLSSSGRIEQVADIISFLHQPESGEEGRVHEATVDVTMSTPKNREGETGSVTLEWFRMWSLFRDAKLDIGEDNPILGSAVRKQ